MIDIIIDISIDIFIDILIDISIDILTGKEEGGGSEGVDFFLKSNDPTPEGGEIQKEIIRKVMFLHVFSKCFFAFLSVFVGTSPSF